MNDSPRPKIALDHLRKMSVEEVLRLDDELLLKAQQEADKAVFDAGHMLDWIRRMIARKKARRHSVGKAES